MTTEEIGPGTLPGELFAALADRPGSFLLESAQPAGGLGQWSFIGCDPFLEFCATGDEIAVTRAGARRVFRGDPLDELRRLIGEFREPAADASVPFAGGAVGYFGYEFGARLERVAPAAGSGLPLPDVAFGFYGGVLAHEQASGKWFAAATGAGGGQPKETLNSLRELARSAGVRPARSGISPTAGAEIAEEDHGAISAASAVKNAGLRSNFTRMEYLVAIGRIKEYIRSGDVYQVNLSQRFDGPLPAPPFELYRRLRRLSPAPFASYLNFGGFQIAGCSPERFLRVRGGRVETRPIKGTRPRGQTPAEDERLRRELQESEKDRAELLMIVDLERNDLGRVCDYGSVAVGENFQLESHPTVHHLVATVSGRLRAGCDAFDCIRAAFPGGSITGAPKVRAMQIIAELETCRRHIYTGAVGYLGFDGACDLNVAIRTLICAGGRGYFHAGGGVVWDSDPAAEYQETLDKARALREAMAES